MPSATRFVPGGARNIRKALTTVPGRESFAVRFFFKNAVFILFPAVMVAIVFLASISFGTAFRFGEWGRRSVAESTLLLTQEKLERVEETINLTDTSFFRAVRPARLETACERWLRLIQNNRLVEAALILDESGETISFYRRDPDSRQVWQLSNIIKREIVPFVDMYESLDRYKHLHKWIGGEWRLITHFTAMFQGRNYTSCLIYDTKEIVSVLFADLLDNLGADRVANIVDDHNRIIFGGPIDETGQFIVARRFPSTFYRWRLQLAPTSDTLFSSRAEAQAKRLSQIVLIPLAVGVILLGLIVLYLSIVRERRVSRLKSDFIANVSHELKTPLSLIRMFGELLLMGKVKDEDKAKRYHEIILRETERLTSLIDNVLNLAKIERGKGDYHFQKADIVLAVERGVGVFRHSLENSGIELRMEIDNNIPQVFIDEHAVTLAVINLVDNAVKYASGTPYIGVELRQSKGFISLDIYDAGIGIPEGHIGRIFERFYRVPSDGTRRQRGSGIGLSLVEHIVKKHNGTLRVSSKPYEETRFSIRFPLEQE